MVANTLLNRSQREGRRTNRQKSVRLWKSVGRLTDYCCLDDAAGIMDAGVHHASIANRPANSQGIERQP